MVTPCRGLVETSFVFLFVVGARADGIPAFCKTRQIGLQKAVFWPLKGRLLACKTRPFATPLIVKQLRKDLRARCGIGHVDL